MLGVTRYTVGVEGGEDRYHQQRGSEWLLVAGGIGEERHEVANTRSSGYSANLNTESELDAALVHFNARAGRDKFNNFEDSRRSARLPGFLSQTVLEGSNDTVDTLEIGADVEFPMTEKLTAKTIALFNLADNSGESSLLRLDPAGDRQSASRSLRETDESELIARLELDWSGISGQQLEANIEGTVNNLENALVS